MGTIDPSQVNADSYCTRHMTPFYPLENKLPFRTPIMVGNKQILYSTHIGNLRLGNIVFKSALFVPGLMQTLLSEAQLERKGVKIVSENGIRSFYIQEW